MGIIAKQSIKGSIYTYTGALLGFINVGLLMPKFFKQEEVGLVNLLIAVTLIFSQFGSFGFPSIISRLFPYFRNPEKKHNGILSLGFIISTVGFLVILIFFLITKDYIIETNQEKSYLFAENVFYLPFLIFFTIFFFLMDHYSKVLFDATLGTFLHDFLLRVINLFLILSFVFNLIDFDEFVFGYILGYIAPTVIFAAILIKRKTFLIGGLNKKLIKKLLPEIIKIGGFGIIAGFSGMAVINIDKYMVNYYLGLSSAGVYSIAFYFGTLIIIPARAVKKISSIVLSEAWKSNDLKTINEVYHKSTVNQFVFGLFLFIGIWANIDNIFKILPDYESGKYVILFIAVANVLEMLSGVSATVISNSAKYKAMGYIMLFTLFNIIILNIILIPIWKLNGAALASLISVSVTVFLKFFFIKKNFKLQPYNFKHFKVLLIGGVTIFINFLIPQLENFYFDIFVRSLIITVIFGLLIYFSNVSQDINRIVKKILFFYAK